LLNFTMFNFTCPRCRDQAFVRSETVVKAAIAYRLFYCGRCDFSWRSGDVAHQARAQESGAADDKPEPSRPKSSRSN
jgi:transcription elongation factor Elf1